MSRPCPYLNLLQRSRSLCRAEEHVLSLPAHPNTSGNAHGQSLAAQEGWRGETSHETTNEGRSWSQLVDTGCSEHWGSPSAGGEGSWAREAQKTLGGCWKGKWVRWRWGNRRKWANLQVRAGFEQRWWEEISGAAQGKLWGGGREGVIHLWGVGSLEGNSKGQEKEMMLRPGGCQW